MSVELSPDRALLERQAGDHPLNILLGLEGLALGGCPINALDLGRELRARGHHVQIFAIDEQVRVSVLPYAEHCGFELILLPQRAGTLARARQIHRLLLDQQTDVLHVFGPWLAQAATIATAGLTTRAPVVTNWMVENVDYVPRRTPLIVGTQRLRVEAEQIQGRPVWLMEPPVDLGADVPDARAGRRFRHELGIADHEIGVVVVSRVDAHLKEEGLRHAVRAVERLDIPDLRLVIVGDGDASARVRSDADDVNRALGRSAVLMPGARHDPRAAYDAADIALGMGGSALRALAHGRPLIVLGTNGFAQTFAPDTREHFATEGLFGESPQPDPAGHLAAELVGLLDPERRRALAEYGLAEVQHFGLTAATDGLERVYRQELSARPAVPRRGLGALSLILRGIGREKLAAFRGW